MRTNTVRFGADGVYVSTWDHVDGSKDETVGTWTAVLDALQVATTERGRVTIVIGPETQVIPYIVDDYRLWLGSILYLRQDGGGL